MENILIREMTEDEIEYCVAVIRRGFGTVARKFGLTMQNCPTNGAFMNVQRLRADREKGKYMYVLQSNDKIIGFMQLDKVDDNRAELQKLTVLPRYRHYGYGKMMLEYAKNKAQILGVKIITLGIIEDNKVLKEWYLTNGFNHNGTRIFEHLPFKVGFMSIEI